MNGATGLDYAGVVAYLSAVEDHKDAQRDSFEAIRAAERAVLEVWAQKAETRRAQTGK